MSQDKYKYSLWFTPAGEAFDQLQALINKLAEQLHAPRFVPHITLAGHIFVDEIGLVEEKKKIDILAGMLGQFSITLTGYGHKDEEYRCLFLRAESPELQEAYNVAASVFPQAEDEHFALMPHLSVLYGQFTEEQKIKIIQANPFGPLTFPAASLDLYRTEGSASEWQKVYSAGLLPPF